MTFGSLLHSSDLDKIDKKNHAPNWLVWLNGSMFAYKVSGCGFESRYCHLNFSYGACFEQGVPWHSGNYECGFTLKHVRDMIITYSPCTNFGYTDSITTYKPYEGFKSLKPEAEE